VRTDAPTPWCGPGRNRVDVVLIAVFSGWFRFRENVGQSTRVFGVCGFEQLT
jgi:hypothetical protein